MNNLTDRKLAHLLEQVSRISRNVELIDKDGLFVFKILEKVKVISSCAKDIAEKLKELNTVVAEEYFNDNLELAE